MQKGEEITQLIKRLKNVFGFAFLCGAVYILLSFDVRVKIVEFRGKSIFLRIQRY